MNHTYNATNRKEVRQVLRSNMTRPEQILWYRLRASQVNGWKFRRQYGVGTYILDFYCPEMRLGVELDGDSHYSNAGRQYDQKRNDFLKLHNIHTLRFTNREVMTNIEGVLSAISSYHP